LEEVEEIRVADAAVYAGRRLHVELEEDGERVELELASEALGLHGRVDAMRRRDGVLVVYEHKRGRPARGPQGPEAWPSDRLQAGAYAMLAEERFPGVPLECRVRYHQQDTTVRFPLDELMLAKLEGQLRFLLRASRGEPESRSAVAVAVRDLRALLPQCVEAGSLASLRGLEGAGAARYFGALPSLLGEDVDARMRFEGRNRRPPRDRFNAVLGFLYGLVHREVEAAIIAVGLDPAFGFYHQPRGSAGPLGLDVMEQFRVPMVDMPLVASINRKTWDPEEDFEVRPEHVWLSKAGRAKAIELYERRKRETWKHNVLGYSLSYARLVELEVRLLEKEWTGSPGLFAKFRLR
jgi:CRISPR-associated endonuclease Cas1